jgi:catechol 2,3-dioxygenase-like lactoylglutathione lyase family enzyme
MKLAKQHLDLGLFTNEKEKTLDFWQTKIQLPFDHLGKLGGGVHQLRHFMGDGPTGPILKINHARDALPDAGPSGLQTLLIARSDISAPISLSDPNGNQVRLVPNNHLGVTHTGIELAVSSLQKFHDFYGNILQLPDVGDAAYRWGQTVLFATENPDLSKDIPYQAQGYRYMTAQIFDADKTHETIVAAGGIEGAKPRTLGTTVRFSFIRDLDGNWIELSERATLTGTDVTDRNNS